jgi:hypothetical protein
VGLLTWTESVKQSIPNTEAYKLDYIQDYCTIELQRMISRYRRVDVMLEGPVAHASRIRIHVALAVQLMAVCRLTNCYMIEVMSS